VSVSKVKQLFGVSFLIGTFTGLAVSFYVFLSKLVAYTFYLGDPFETIPRLPFWYVAFVTTASILLVNLIILHNDRAKEYGVREIAQALEENKITFTLGDLALKIVASAISIGSGFAVGNEGPSAA
jgi:CIC family chloride channel protein